MSAEPDLKNDPTLGPFLNALLCEKILEEKDGIKTAVRIIDQVNRSAVGMGQAPPSVMDEFVFPVALLIRLKAGVARGMVSVKVKIIRPNNTTAGDLTHPVHLPGPDDSGVDIVLNVQLKIDQVGAWWFDIYVDELRWMRVPLRIVYLPQSFNQPSL